MGKGDPVRIGYRYYLKVHTVMCHGPVNGVLRILGDGREAWSGVATGAAPEITVDAPRLFGGSKNEGGYAGIVTVCNGEVPSGVRTAMAAELGNVVPGYKGLTSLFWHGDGTQSAWLPPGFPSMDPYTDGFYWTAITPYIKAPEVELWRTTSGWYGGTAWYSAKASIGYDMNPAHIIYQCLTDPEWGMGYPTADMDGDVGDTFRAAADKLYTEGFGLSLSWTGDMTVDAFVQIILDHIDGVLRLNLATGKFELALLRDDYVLGDLPVIDTSNVKALESFSRATWGDLTNEVIVKYQDYDNNEKTASAQDLAAISSQGGVVSKTLEFPGLRSDTLAARVAQRELLRSSSLLAQVSLRCNRDAASLNVGDVFRFEWAPLGITNLAMRVVKVDRGSLTDGTVRVEAVEDIFGLPDSSYVGQQSGLAPAISTMPQDPDYVKVSEWPYYAMATEMSAANFNAVSPGASFGHLLAGRPNGSHYDFMAYEDSLDEPEEAPSGTFSPCGVTTASVTPTQTSVVLTNTQEVSSIEPGAWGYLGDEAVRVDSVSGDTLTVARGCLDTVAQAHAAGTLFILGQRVGAVDPTERSASESVTYEPLTRTSRGVLDPADATDYPITFDDRPSRPYPPGKFQINGSYYPATITGALTVSWTHRDRTQQTASVLDHTYGNVGPEAGVTYTLMLYDENGVLRRTETGLSGTSYTWSTEEADSLLPPATLNTSVRVRLKAVRSGIESWQEHDWTVTR